MTKRHWLLGLCTLGLCVLPSWFAAGQSKVPTFRPPVKPIPAAAARSGSVASPAPSTTAAISIAYQGGSFTLGTEAGDASEKPAHAASVAAFDLEAREITVELYQACVSAGRCSIPGTGNACNWGVAGKEKHPVNCVDWYQATDYCAYKGRRLPTEQEWEFAAREPDGRLYPWGAAALATQACWNRGSQGTCVAGSMPAGKTPRGAFDLSGNVAEWTSGPFCPYGAGGCVTTDRAVRGGSWSQAIPSALRSTARAGFAKGVRSSTIGFRCAGSPSTNPS